LRVPAVLRSTFPQGTPRSEDCSQEAQEAPSIGQAVPAMPTWDLISQEAWFTGCSDIPAYIAIEFGIAQYQNQLSIGNIRLASVGDAVLSFGDEPLSLG